MEELVARSSLVIALYGRSGASSCGHSRAWQTSSPRWRQATPSGPAPLMLRHIDHIEADLDLAQPRHWRCATPSRCEE